LWYDLTKQYVSERNSREKLHPTDHLGASAFAGILTCCCTNPIWVYKFPNQSVKTRMFAQNSLDANAYNGLAGIKYFK
jgi:hypothetical protein